MDRTPTTSSRVDDLQLLGEVPRSAADLEYRRVHPEPTTLLLMRFDDTAAMRAIDAGVRAAGARHGREVVRADDRDFTGELWADVALYMRNSDLVIAVLDEIDRHDCDPNVMVEIGFALASQRRCLLLVEQRQRVLPAVLRHRLTHKFDALDLPASIERQVDLWLHRNAPSRDVRL